MIRIPSLALAGWLLVPAALPAQSAFEGAVTMKITTPDGIGMTPVVHVKGGRSHMEMAPGGMTMYQIVDLDKETMMMVMPAQRMYMTINMKDALAMAPPEQVKRAKALARNSGADIIDLGMGNPDLPAPVHVIEKVKETLGKPRTDRYSSSKGIAGLRRAQAAYYARRFGVKLNPDTQVVATLGSKEGFANMAQAITGPGDVILVPNPTYPIHEFGFIMSGGVIRHLPASTDSNFMASLSRAVKHSVPKPSALVLNYPANPTAVVADLDFYREIVSFAMKNDLIVLSDLAYAEIYFEGNPPPSILDLAKAAQAENHPTA